MTFGGGSCWCSNNFAIINHTTNVTVWAVRVPGEQDTIQINPGDQVSLYYINECNTQGGQCDSCGSCVPVGTLAHFELYDVPAPGMDTEATFYPVGANALNSQFWCNPWWDYGMDGYGTSGGKTDAILYAWDEFQNESSPVIYVHFNVSPVKLYACNVDNRCVEDPLCNVGDPGCYTDPNCLGRCVIKYACSGSPNYQCGESARGYDTIEQCQTACQAPSATKYNCNSVTHQCQGPYVTGQYDSLATCQAVCKASAQKWKCTDPATNTCIQASNGTFDTEALCKAATNCQPAGVQSWYCDTSTKICSLQAGSGGYPTKADCDAACSGGGGEDPCITCDKTKQFCILGQCIDKNTVYIGVGLFAGLLILTKK